MAVKASTEKAKATRARSWAKNQEAKKARIADNEKRHEHNVSVGSTGKQRANQAAKVARKLDKAMADSAKGNTKDLGDFTQYADQEDLLEM